MWTHTPLNLISTPLCLNTNILRWTHLPLQTHTHTFFYEHTHKHTLPGSLSLSSTPDFVPVTLGECCQWLLLRFLRRGLEGGWRKAWPGITQLPSLYPSVRPADEWKKSFPTFCWQMAVEFLGTHEEFIYNEAPLWIPAPSTTSFIFKLCVMQFSKIAMTDHRQTMVGLFTTCWPTAVFKPRLQE